MFTNKLCDGASEKNWSLGVIFYSGDKISKNNHVQLFVFEYLWKIQPSLVNLAKSSIVIDFKMN